MSTRLDAVFDHWSPRTDNGDGSDIWHGGHAHIRNHGHEYVLREKEYVYPADWPPVHLY